jgi:hypothetical protein
MTARNASPKVRDRRHAWTLAVVTAMVILAGCSFSDTEQKYLNAMHNPCQHSEIFSNAQYCSFMWGGDEKAQVSEGYEICDIENKVSPDAIYTAPYNYLQSHHPDYSREQINTQLIAAENTLCKG